MKNPVDEAKRILIENSKVLYGIFGIVKGSGYFPPNEFLNQFLLKGSDPCDQDGRMKDWKPFALSSDNYLLVKEWWVRENPGTVEDSLGADDWMEWTLKILEDDED
jgi:hypothetical protein